MKGTVNAFYGAEAKQDNGQPAGTLKNKEVVKIIEASGKPAWHVGEWVKVKGSITGWVKAEMVNVDYE
jgi:hypothetical protein